MSATNWHGAPGRSAVIAPRRCRRQDRDHRRRRDRDGFDRLGCLQGRPFAGRVPSCRGDSRWRSPVDRRPRPGGRRGRVPRDAGAIPRRRPVVRELLGDNRHRGPGAPHWYGDRGGPGHRDPCCLDHAARRPDRSAGRHRGRCLRAWKRQQSQEPAKPVGGRLPEQGRLRDRAVRPVDPGRAGGPSESLRHRIARTTVGGRHPMGRRAARSFTSCRSAISGRAPAQPPPCGRRANRVSMCAPSFRGEGVPTLPRSGCLESSPRRFSSSARRTPASSPSIAAPRDTCERSVTCQSCPERRISSKNPEPCGLSPSSLVTGSRAISMAHGTRRAGGAQDDGDPSDSRPSATSNGTRARSPVRIRTTTDSSTSSAVSDSYCWARRRTERTSSTGNERVSRSG